MKKNRYVLMILVLGVMVTIQSCRLNIKNEIIGKWVVEQAVYQNVDIKSCLLINIIEFKEENTCILPVFSSRRCYGLPSNISKASWEISHTDTIPIQLKIKSESSVFSDNYRVVFTRDEVNSILRMEILSDSTYLLCNKELYDYGNNQNAINKLVEMTHQDEHVWSIEGK